MQLLTEHSYEELRAVVVDILLGRENIRYEPTQWGNFINGVGEVLARRANRVEDRYLSSSEYHLHPNDAELVRDIFWDLFRQGFVTLGSNDSNPMWPHFRLSRFGAQTLGTQNPFRFHDTGSFLALVREEVPDISAEAVAYLEEAVATFYADCLLACCVMLGVAAEVEFQRLVEVAANSTAHAPAFGPVLTQKFIRQKITNRPHPAARSTREGALCSTICRVVRLSGKIYSPRVAVPCAAHPQFAIIP